MSDRPEENRDERGNGHDLEDFEPTTPGERALLAAIGRLASKVDAGIRASQRAEHASKATADRVTELRLELDLMQGDLRTTRDGVVDARAAINRGLASLDGTRERFEAELRAAWRAGSEGRPLSSIGVPEDRPTDPSLRRTTEPSPPPDTDPPE